MINVDDLLADLTLRLPELEWKMNELNDSFSANNLPRGLFQFKKEKTAKACIEEIKTDINALTNEKNERSAVYLAQRIQQKINVLVVLCQIKAAKSQAKGNVGFGLKMLSTRQQWIQSLEEEVHTLSLQQQAMINAKEQMQSNNNTIAMLSVQKELGEVERRLTLAKETLNHATK